MKFLVPNYSCLQNPWLGGYRPQISVLSLLCLQLSLLNKIAEYATVDKEQKISSLDVINASVMAVTAWECSANKCDCFC